jgi:hypothetical protein
MTSPKSYREMRAFKATNKFNSLKQLCPQYKKEEAAFVFREEGKLSSISFVSSYYFRTHPFTKRIAQFVDPLFGMQNNLFEDQCDTDPKLFSESSCQASSAVWCKYALQGSPDEDVHGREPYTDEIYKLCTTAFYNNIRKFGTKATSRQGLADVVKGTLDGVGKYERPVLNASIIQSTSQPVVLNQALSYDGSATIILQDAHVIAIYTTRKQVHYCFDNNVGCVKTLSRTAAVRWLLWAGERNIEGVTKEPTTKKLCFPANWWGVKCTLRRT